MCPIHSAKSFELTGVCPGCVISAWNIHTHPDVLTALAKSPRITPVWLPTYAPHLNLLERVWRFLKQKLACHRFWDDPTGLGHLALTLLDQTEARFHRPDRPNLRLGQNFWQSA